jgi:hypothetical protein
MTSPIDEALAAKIMLAGLFFDLELDGRIEDGEAPDELMELRARAALFFDLCLDGRIEDGKAPDELVELPALPEPWPHSLAA